MVLAGQIVMRDFMIHDGLEFCHTKPTSSHYCTLHSTTVNVSCTFPPLGFQAKTIHNPLKIIFHYIKNFYVIFTD